MLSTTEQVYVDRERVEAVVTDALLPGRPDAWSGPAGAPARLLIIDDEPGLVSIVERFARQFGYHVEHRADANEALALLGAIKPDVVLVDLPIPDLSGLDVLRLFRVASPACEVILTSARATVDHAIEAVKGGALDYLSKPFDFERLRSLLVSVRDGLRPEPTVAEIEPMPDAGEDVDFHGIIGRSEAMRRLFAWIERLAPHARSVLISGETGTGKELVAKALHRAGRRRDRQFVTVNCSAVVPTLFESELFGHVRGAFTGATDAKVGLFEHASGGTLFLDEAGELPLAAQAKLLRAVEYGELQRVGSLEARKADVCVIAATNRDLRTEVAAGRFRSDLFYRLGILEVHIPPLRDRREDIPLLTRAFIAEFAARCQRQVTGVTPTAARLLQYAPWPGNVRELRNVIERACIMSDGRLLTEGDLIGVMSVRAGACSPPRSAAGTAGHAAAADSSLSSAQRDQICRVLRDTQGNKAAAATRLGVSRRSLYRWLDRLDIQG